MNFFEQYLDPTMERPIMYGWFHWMWLGILTIAIIIFIIKFKKTSDRTNRRIFFIFTIVFFVLEMYKQINFTLSAGHYRWYAFPFQFCSIPIYLFPFMIFLKEGKLKNVFYDFTGTFIFAAGISVLVYPEGVYVSSIGINIQTMIHHSLMVLAGLYVITSNRAKLTYKGFVHTILVFIGFVFLADIMNVVFHHFIITDETFNMFMISPYFKNNMPLLMTLKERVPYIVFLICYIISVSIITFIALNIGRGIQRLIDKQVFCVHKFKLIFNKK